MKKINWGVIGLGFIANKFANSFSFVNNANLKGIASLNKDRLQLFKKRCSRLSRLSYKHY